MTGRGARRLARWLAPALLAASLTANAAAIDIPILPLQVHRAYDGFGFPVSFAFAPDGRLFVTEKAGTVLVVDAGGVRTWATLNVTASGEQGLLGLALDPGFATNGHAYVYYTDPGNDTNRVGRLTEAAGVGGSLTVLFDGIPRAAIHNGGILAFREDGTLFASTGDAANSVSAQDIGSSAGKVLRIGTDGSIPPDNPFPGSAVFSYGHRNVFGLAVDPATGDLWETENGPTEDDEVNRIVPGGNYGWPIVTGVANQSSFVDPAYVFPTDLPALTQATFLQGDLFFGGWNSGSVYRARLRADRQGIASVEVVYTFGGSGVTDVEIGPDGRLYASAVARDGSSGAIFAFESLSPTGESHLLAYSVLVVPVAVLLLLYEWRRRRLERERS